MRLFAIKKYRKDKLILITLLIFTLLFILSLGLFELYSSGGIEFFKKQLNNILIGLIISFFILIINSKIIFEFAYIFYISGLILLLCVEIFGHTSMGATRWLKFASFRFQPSEIVKFTTILGLASVLSNSSKLDTLRSIILPFFIIFFPSLLIVKQPDLGTGLILLFTCVIMLFCANISWRLIFGSIFSLICISPFIWLNMYEYQKKRVLIFFLNDDKLNSGYNVHQSQIAIASGGKFGTGFKLGSQTQFGFLPENHTDFIFSAFAEEFGLFLSSVIIIAYGIVIYILWHMSFSVKDRIHQITIAGCASLFFFHVFINIGMVMSILPVVGIPLPFFSYGGAVTINTMIMIAFCINLYLSDNNKTN
ncbi:MAG: FtsW/RodA/SpoVE family cell cycle protein [Rickettsiales bacterium]